MPGKLQQPNVFSLHTLHRSAGPGAIHSRVLIERRHERIVFLTLKRPPLLDRHCMQVLCGQQVVLQPAYARVERVVLALQLASPSLRRPQLGVMVRAPRFMSA